ncbi:hypothetical protein CL176_01035 [Suicoccus acidiformans]|uniref:ABC transmembrane type-1 domain-containing protein n=1 Tax=Suicoccus acidiformans TaxID=2036206 RepID=A0A347WI17_9LACT|nr:hypothetical protein CL176_01035 [Suicoccus acidiformans]
MDKGGFLPEVLLRIPVAVSSLFSSFLQFVIPLMIVSFVVSGITKLSDNAGQLIGVLMSLSYGSLVLAGLMTFVVGQTILLKVINEEHTLNFAEMSQ